MRRLIVIALVFLAANSCKQESVPTHAESAVVTANTEPRDRAPGAETLATTEPAATGVAGRQEKHDNTAKGKDLGKGWVIANVGHGKPVEVDLSLVGMQFDSSMGELISMLELRNDSHSPIALTQGKITRRFDLGTVRSRGVAVNSDGEIVIEPSGQLAAACAVKADKSTRDDPIRCDLFPDAR